MSRYYRPTKEAAQRLADQEDAISTWVLENLKPGMKCRFKGSRSNRVRGQYRVVLELGQSPHTRRIGYPNPDYVEFDSEHRYGTPGWKADREEYQRLPEHMRTSSLYVHCRVPRVSVTSKNERPGVHTHEVVVSGNEAVYLKEVEIGGRWVKAKDLIERLAP